MRLGPIWRDTDDDSLFPLLASPDPPEATSGSVSFTDSAASIYRPALLPPLPEPDLDRDLAERSLARGG